MRWVDASSRTRSPESDLEQIRQLILDLASYERAAQEVKTTTEQLRVALFGPQPAAYALVAKSGSQVVGFASTFVTSPRGKAFTDLSRGPLCHA